VSSCHSNIRICLNASLLAWITSASLREESLECILVYIRVSAALIMSWFFWISLDVLGVSDIEGVSFDGGGEREFRKSSASCVESSSWWFIL